jgi:hypothetical protein
MGYAVIKGEGWEDFVDAVVMDPGWAGVLLAREPGLLEARGPLGETPLLFLSIEFFGLGPIAWLLNRGANINATDQFGGTAISYALQIYQRPLADYLLARGASLEFSVLGHGTIVDMAKIEQAPDWKAYLISLAARAGKRKLNWG